MAHLYQIGPESAQRAYEFCADHPDRCTYIAGWIHEGGLDSSLAAPKGWLLAEQPQDGAIVGLAYISATGILIPALRSESSFEQIVSLARMNPGMIRVLVGERHIVNRLWAQLEALGLRTRLARDQLVFSVDRASFVPAEPSLTLARATDRDLDDVVTASADMAREEANDDPQSRNPTLFRERIRTRLMRQRDFVHREDGVLAFKSNVSALSPMGGQLEGVFTVPRFRQLGLGSRGTGAVSAWILERASRVVLLVNDDNELATRLYERLGYMRSHLSKTIFIAP